MYRTKAGFNLFEITHPQVYNSLIIADRLSRKNSLLVYAGEDLMDRSKAVRALEALDKKSLALSEGIRRGRTEEESGKALIDLKNRRGRSAADLLLSKDLCDQAEALLLVREHLNCVIRAEFMSTAPT